MDVCKIAPGIYQYTAIDDCSRFKVLELFPRRTATNTLKFLETVMEQMPFAIQRIQTDRGKEFFAYSVQDRLMEYGIKFRPIKPGSPHLNGKVERTQRTDLDEFYSTVDIKDPDLPNLLSQWQFHYNWLRSHSSLKGRAPIQVITALRDKTPLWEDVGDMYDHTKERIRDQNYWIDCQLINETMSVNPTNNLYIGINIKHRLYFVFSFLSAFVVFLLFGEGDGSGKYSIWVSLFFIAIQIGINTFIQETDCCKGSY